MVPIGIQERSPDNTEKSFLMSKIIRVNGRRGRNSGTLIRLYHLQLVTQDECTDFF